MQLSYRYEFAPHELDPIKWCLEEHGFAIVKKLLTPELVEALSKSVRSLMTDDKLPAGTSNLYHTQFVERSPELLSLIRYRPYMDVAEKLLGTRELTVHRSAAIIREPGDNGMQWHSDFCHPTRSPENASAFLNTLEVRDCTPSLWFYLTGCNPTDGGVALIPDSHRPDWQPPRGYELTPNRHGICKAGEPHPTLDMNFPGVLPVRTEPGDMIIFGLVTFHGVHNHRGTQTRLSCALNFRPRSVKFKAPWELTDEARQFLATVPADLREYTEGYVGLNRSWRPKPAVAMA